MDATARADAAEAKAAKMREALEAAKNWLEYDNSQMGPAEEKAYWLLRKKIDAALDQEGRP